MARELPRLEQANVMAQYWLQDLRLEKISFAVTCGAFKVTLDLENATGVWFEGTWRIIDGSETRAQKDFERAFQPLCDDRYYDATLSSRADILRLAMLAGIVKVKSVEIFADQTLKILFDNEIALVVNKSPQEPDSEYPVYESPCWRIEQFAANSLEIQGRPRSFIWADNDGSWNGIWRLSERYDNFKARFPDGLIIALPHRHSESSIKVLLKPVISLAKPQMT
jgi:hypothetical protein